MESTPSLLTAPAVAASRHPGFTSFKTAAPIQYPKRWFRAGLIRATFDERVEEISPAITPPADLPEPFQFSFRQRTAKGLAIVLLSQSPHAPEIETPNNSVIVWRRQELEQGPRALASKAIWAQKRAPVDTADRYRVIELLTLRDGTAPFSVVVPVLRNTSLDPVHQIFSFIATGYLTTSLDAGISPATRLKIGPMARTG